MSTGTLQLPAFLTEPLTCPPNRCNYPERPFPPVPNELETLLPIYLVGRIRDGTRYVSLIDHEKKSTEERGKAMEGIVDFLRRGGSPKELRQWKSPRSKPPPSDDPKTIEDRIIPTIRFYQCEAMEEIFKVFTSDRLKRPCVHDLLNPSHLGIWDKVAARRQCSPRTEFKRPDEQSLLDRISESIVAGELDDSGWEARWNGSGKSRWRT